MPCLMKTLNDSKEEEYDEENIVMTDKTSNSKQDSNDKVKVIFYL